MKNHAITKPSVASDGASKILSALDPNAAKMLENAEPIDGGLHLNDRSFELIVDIEAANLVSANGLHGRVQESNCDLAIAFVEIDPARTLIDVVLRDFKGGIVVVPALSFWLSESNNVWLCDRWHHNRYAVSLTDCGLNLATGEPWTSADERTDGYARAARQLRREFGFIPTIPTAFGTTWW